MLGSRTDLHIFDAGSVNRTRYCNEILLPYVRLFRGAMGLRFLFMDDNAPCHRTVAAEQLLESEDIERMDWPARSPDLNPIEHVWDFLRQTLGSSYLTTSNDSGASIGAAKTNGQQCLNNSLTRPHSQQWADAVETLPSSQGRSYPLLKTGCFLLDTHHRDVSAFSRIALHATFSIKLLFIPLISLLIIAKRQVVYTGTKKVSFHVEDDVSGKFINDNFLINESQTQLVPAPKSSSSSSSSDSSSDEQNCPGTKDARYTPPIGEVYIPINVDTSMSPSFTLLVFYVREDREIVAVAQKIQVEKCFKNKACASMVWAGARLNGFVSGHNLRVA
ncbi:c3 and PZP-like alpha-2-macroglobulin domain-containing protein 8 [Trichonephila clavipes]|nr:c3 and PZP-like alpha-2-macroglobulin domain-containing protein 8 [Trichonephila clavipes]